MEAFFTVIVTTYNRAKILPIALESLIQQTERNWDAWIIDDGSTDETLNVIESFLNDPRMNYLKTKNQGEATAKNQGIQLAKGEFITFLDSDDAYLPFHLEHRKKLLIQNPEVDFLHGGVKIIGDVFVPDLDEPNRMIHLSNCAIGGSFFIRKEILHQLNGFKNLSLGTDADLYRRAQKLGVNLLKTDVQSYIYNRSLENSITHNFMK